MTTETQSIIFNDSSMYASNIKWRDDIEPTPINDYEKKMISHTKSAEQLLQEEKDEEVKELSEKQSEYIKRKEYITKIKVIALDSIGKSPIYNASYLSHRDKQKLIKQMDETMKLSDQEITNKFNEICNDKLFNIGLDVSSYPVYTLPIHDC